jgi:hypothetical protein
MNFLTRRESIITLLQVTSPSSGDHSAVLLALFIVLLAAKLVAALCERIRQPAVVRERSIAAGPRVGVMFRTCGARDGCYHDAGRPAIDQAGVRW